MNFDYLINPNRIIPNTFILKGLIRALAGVSTGAFLYGIISGNGERGTKLRIKEFKPVLKRLIIIADILLWGCIIVYLVYPFQSNSSKLKIQYDYIIALLMALAMDCYFEKKKRIYRIAGILGRYSFFAYFGQGIFYSVDEIVYNSEISAIMKVAILNVSVIALSIIMWIFITRISKVSKKSFFTNTVK